MENKKNVLVHSKLKEKPKKVFFFFFLPNNLHIPKELGLSIFLIGMGLSLEGPLFLASQVGLKYPNFLTIRTGLEAFEQYFCKAYTTRNAVTSP